MNIWYKNLNKPFFTPPAWVFKVVWPILYSLMFIATLIVAPSKKCNFTCNAVIFFAIQLFFNVIYTTLFFKFKNLNLALFDLILILIFATITFYQYYPINKKAAYLLIPYLLWLKFAFLINLYLVIFN